MRAFHKARIMVKYGLLFNEKRQMGDFVLGHFDARIVICS
jgi:hypothetical protein